MSQAESGREAAGRGRRGRTVACLLTAAGGAVMLLAAGRVWASAEITQAPLPPRRLGVTGSDLGGGVRAPALVALAGVAALIALRGRWRMAGGLVLVAAGIAAMFAFRLTAADGVRRSPSVADQRSAGADVAVSGRSGWPYGYLAGAGAVTVAGAMAAAGSRHWPVLGARYDRPTSRPAGRGDPWTALDRGEDPTAD